MLKVNFSNLPILLRRFFYIGMSYILLLYVMPLAAQSPTDNRDNFPAIYTVSPKGVNLQTGRFTYSKTDISIGSLNFVRTYGGPRVAMFGLNGVPDQNARNGWAHSFAHGTYTTNQGVGGGQLLIHFVVPGQTYSFFLGSGSPIYYSSLASPDAAGSTVSVVGQDYRLETKNGDVFYFYKHPALQQLSGAPAPLIQVLRRIEYTDGSSLDYSYNSHGQPRTVISNRGYAIVMDYNSAGSVSSVCGYNMTVQFVNSTTTTCVGAALKVSYEYIAGPALSRVIDASGQAVTISYTAGVPSCISLVNSSTCEISNVYGTLAGEPSGITKADQVRQQTTATGDVWRYHYDPGNIYVGPDAPPTPREPQITYSTMIDPHGYETVGTYRNGFVELIEAPQGPTRYVFNGTVPMKITFPAGNSTVYNRDAFQNLMSRVTMPLPGVSLTPLIVTQTFPQVYDATALGNGCNAASRKFCTKPITRVDERGNQTDFTYATEHGGILTETAPAVNGIRPQTRYTYAQRYAWVKNSSGAFVPAVSAIWVLTQKSYCKAGAASGAGCAVAGDEVRTTYDYGPDSGPNNLLLRGQVDDAGGLNLRTCYGYDWLGRKISETSPRAGLAVCS